MHEYETVKSNNFIETGSLREMQTAPSVMFKNNEFIINEASLLFQSIKEIKNSYTDIQSGFDDVRESVSKMDGEVRESENESEINSKKLMEL
jgi:uncharacterized protein (UPF0305 family)